MNKFGNFTSGSEDYWTPSYGDIDWKLRRQRMIADDMVEDYQPVGFDSDDGLVQEVHQDNMSFFLNRVAPEMDMLAVFDPRDEKEYTWFRGEDDGRFADLVTELGRAATVQTTEFPNESIVNLYLERATTGLGTEFLDEPM